MSRKLKDGIYTFDEGFFDRSVSRARSQRVSARLNELMVHHKSRSTFAPVPMQKSKAQNVKKFKFFSAWILAALGRSSGV